MRPLLAAYLAILTLLAGLATIGGMLLFRETGPSDAIEGAADQHRYSLASWELTQFPRKWLYKIEHIFDSRSREEDDAAIRRYFSLTEEIKRLEQESNAPTRLEDARRERAEIKNDVQEIIEGRVTAIFEDQGLALKPPLFSDLGLVFPPVDFALDSPPRLLVVSPRDRIELDGSYLLSPGLDTQTVAGIERDAEAGNAGEAGVSALVISTGGLAAYPSIIPEQDSYESMIDTVFHEWTHQYLVFFPLGAHYARSAETRTLNESVANLTGHEMAHLYFARYGSLDTSASLKPAPAQAAGFDFTKELRELRRQVEALLQQRRIAEAEALMNQKRDEFAAKGVYIRRLNQAYFAFHGSYADTPGSIDPIGPKLQTLLARAGSPGEFVRLASDIASQEELDALLAGM